jgi:hypothetical protein
LQWVGFRVHVAAKKAMTRKSTVQIGHTNLHRAVGQIVGCIG